jgi:serine/threonine protein phosphatase PrpC
MSIYSAARVAGTVTFAGGVNGVAKENQDSFFIIPGGETGRAGDFAAGVLDGHGADGRRVSKFVAAKIKASLERYFARVVAFAEADAALRAAPRGSVEHEESGCTCVVVVRLGEMLLTANVGDSRAVLCGARHPTSGSGSPSVSGPHSFLELSSDHKPDRPDERARIERTGAGCVERARDGFFGFAGPHRVWLKSTPRSGGLAVSRAFGDTRLARAGVTPTPEITVTDMRHPGTHGVDAPLCVVLASDGVWDHVSSAAAAAAAAAAFGSLGPNPRMSDPSDALAREAKAAADTIAAKAVAGWRGAANGGYRDDITVAVAPLIRYA